MLTVLNIFGRDAILFTDVRKEKDVRFFDGKSCAEQKRNV